MKGIAGIVIGISALLLQTRTVALELPPTSSPDIDLSFASTPNPDAVRIGPSNAVSFCPALSCINTPRDQPDTLAASFLDHQRASLLLSAATHDDGHSQEQTLAVTTTIGTGYAKPYAASTPYIVGDNVDVGNAVYRAIVAGTTGVNSAPPGKRPTAAQGGAYYVTDGGVTWQWVNDASINAKIGSYFETKVVSGAGAAWGAAFNYHFTAKPKVGMFLPGVEMDYSNDSGTACALGVTDCTALRLAMSGGQVTEGLQVTGKDGVNGNDASYSSIWAIRVNGDHVASQSAIEVDAAAPVGLGFGISGIGGASHSIATIRDATTSPATLSIDGEHSVAGIVDRSTSRNGFLLEGRYADAQMAGIGWKIDPSGQIVARGLRSLGRIQGTLATPQSSSAPCTAGQFEDDIEYHYVCVATNTWKRVALSSF